MKPPSTQRGEAATNAAAGVSPAVESGVPPGVNPLAPAPAPGNFRETWNAPLLDPGGGTHGLYGSPGGRRYKTVAVPDDVQWHCYEKRLCLAFQVLCVSCISWSTGSAAIRLPDA